MSVVERFLRYVKTDTASDPDAKNTPSTAKQFDLARMLRDELTEMGAKDVTMTENCYVYATIPSNIENVVPKLGFIAHLDTAPVVSGTDVKPRIFEKYDGGTLDLGHGVKLSPSEFPHLMSYVGQDLITASGDTLLGADDKAGVAEIMAACELLLKDKNIRHGEIGVAFAPDEEIGHGASLLNVEEFGCKYAFTVDGGALGEIEYENFNAAHALITIKGVSIHPGDAKGKMVNAVLVANDIISRFDIRETPAMTEKYEGFFHFDRVNALVDSAEIECIIRDHDADKFQAKKEYLKKVCVEAEAKYGTGSVRLELSDSYRNMKEKILPHMHLIENAEKAMQSVGAVPTIIPIRGGTDGAQLSFRGLPCPNLSTGGHNFHGLQEYISVQSMEKMTAVLIELAKLYAE